MTHTRHIGALSALALTLVLGACSTPEDLIAPTLAPQFGTAEDDRGVDVATVSTGRIYTLSEEFGPNPYDEGSYSYVLLTRQDGNGNVTWSSYVDEATCRDYGDYYSCHTVKPISVFADTQGNVSVLTSRSSDYYEYYDYDYSYSSVTYTIRKYDALGNYLSEVSFVNGDLSLDPIDFAVDGSGNFYVARRDGNTSTSSVAKYSTSGNLLWQRTSSVGTPSDITVSSTGSVYVVGSAGIARYSSSGGLTWKKTGNFEQVMLSGSNIYTRYRKDIRKYDGTGRQLWLRSQSGLSTIVLQDMDGDGSGNVYLSGKYDAGSGNFNAMVRKLSSSGSVLWTRKYGTTAYDDARGIATITGSEIYTTGETQGSLAHTNIGGRDGYLRKFSSSGSALWTR